MATASLRREAPASRDEAAAAMRDLVASDGAVRFVGGGTKLGWGGIPAPADLELSTGRLDRMLEHNRTDFTAVVEAGIPLARIQRELGEAGQMLALDPPLGDGEQATVGGVFATADAGPLRHRYGAPRDLALGITVALGDGTLAKAGGKVIKNVAGYDLAKLFTGAFGTLGLIVDVSVRLHPAPGPTATATARSDDPDGVGAAASALAHSPLEAESLDVRWDGGHGAVLARFGGAAAGDQARAAVARLERAGGGMDADLTEDDAAIWAEQRARQRSADGAVVKVSGLPARLPDVLRGADRAGGTLVGRAAHGLSWVRLPEADAGELAAAIGRLRAELAPFSCVILDAPRPVRAALDVWDEGDRGRLGLSRRIKARFDPGGACNPGVFVGGI